MVTEHQLQARLKSTTKPIAAAFVRKGSGPAESLLSALKSVKSIEVLVLDIDACPSLVEELRIHRVPELLVWSPKAKLVARMEGAMNDEQVADFIEHALTRF